MACRYASLTAAKLSPESVQQPETASSPSQNGGVVSNGDHTQEPPRPSLSPTLQTDSGEKDATLASNGAPPAHQTGDTPPHGCPEGRGLRSPVATSVGEEQPPVKPPRRKGTSQSPSQSPAQSPAQSPQHQRKKERSEENSLAGESGLVTADQPAIVSVETSNSSTPPEGSQTAGQTTEQPTSPVDSTRPSIPPRPYRPPRPFPPPSKRVPPKARSHDPSPGSPDAQTVPSEDGSEAQSKQKSPDRSAGSPDQLRESHDQQGSEATAVSRQNGSTEPAFVEVPLVTEAVAENKPEGESPVQARTLFELDEAEDEVSGHWSWQLAKD